MTRTEFAGVMQSIAGAVGKEPSARGAEVYFDLLGDLPLPAFQAAAKRAILEHEYASFPTVAMLRRLAMEAIEATEPTAGEAFRLACMAARRISGIIVPHFVMLDVACNCRQCAPSPTNVTSRCQRYGRPLSDEERAQECDRRRCAIFDDLPGVVRYVIEVFGLNRLREDTFTFAQFRDCYEEIAQRERSQRFLPAALRADLAAIGAQQKAPLLKVVSAIGEMPDGKTVEAGAA
jgi:hypothetical protein